MTVRKLSQSTEAELRNLLGRHRLALTEVAGRRVLLQVIEDEFDLDAFLEDRPEAVSQIEAGLHALKHGDVIDHEEVVRSSLTRDGGRMKYLVVVEKAENNWAAYSPDVPDCIATGKTPEKALEEYAKALRFHLEGLAEDGLPAPQPTARADYVDAG